MPLLSSSPLEEGEEDNQETNESKDENEEDNLKSSKKQQQLQWAASLQLEDMQMNADKSSITTIGGQDCQKIPVGILIAFARRNGVKVKNNERKRDRVLETILGLVKGEAFRAAVVDGPKKKRKKTTEKNMGDMDSVTKDPNKRRSDESSDESQKLTKTDGDVMECFKKIANMNQALMEVLNKQCKEDVNTWDNKEKEQIYKMNILRRVKELRQEFGMTDKEIIEFIPDSEGVIKFVKHK